MTFKSLPLILIWVIFSSEWNEENRIYITEHDTLYTTYHQLHLNSALCWGHDQDLLKEKGMCKIILSLYKAYVKSLPEISPHHKRNRVKGITVYYNLSYML